MKNDEMKKILYDLHKENKEDIKELRKDITSIKIHVSNHIVHYKTTAAVLGAVGGVLTTAIYIAIKLFG